MSIRRLQRRLALCVTAALAALGVTSATRADYTTEYTAELIQKAPVDECYNGKGGEYLEPTDGTCPAGTRDKRNGSYVWGMVAAKNILWWGTAENLACIGPAASSYLGDGPDFEPPDAIIACEGTDSQYPLPADTSLLIRELVGGDWRPPEVWTYDIEADEVSRVLFSDPLLHRTVGLRSAGAAKGVVFLAGPTGFGLAVFAFDADTKDYLGSRYSARYTNIRKWTNANGELYTAVQDAAGGGGTVLRWVGSKSDPMRFEIVGELDNEGAELVAHEGRLYVGTWPGSTLSSLGSPFAESPPAGIWMSPLLGRYGLRYWDRKRWQKVFSIDEYEPNLFIAETYAIGSMASYNGFLQFGTMHVPQQAGLNFTETFGEEPTLEDLPNLDRAVAVFRGRGFDRDRSLELLYGEELFPVYSADTKVWSDESNGLGETPANGPESSGFFNDTNWYYYVSEIFDGLLWVGTREWRIPDGPPPGTTPPDPPPAPAQQVPQVAGSDVIEDVIGADLFIFPRDDSTTPDADEGQTAVAYDLKGLDNPLNESWRTISAHGRYLFLGSGVLPNVLPNAGWEVYKIAKNLGSCSDAQYRPTGDQEPGRLRVTFRWCNDDNPDASAYQLQVRRNGWLVFSKWLEQEEPVWHPWSALRCGAYSWRIRPRQDQLVGSWSGWKGFTLPCEER